MFADFIEEGSFRFQMRFEREALDAFYGPTEQHREILAERQKWLSENPSRHLAVLPEGEPLLAETAALTQISALSKTGVAKLGKPAIELAHWLGERLEPDYLLLAPAESGSMRLLAGCVCFPSSWALEDKIGKPMEEIHGVVPGLNQALGKQISSFLSKIKPGTSWNRSNWGLSRTAERNQHPARQLPRLDAQVDLDEVFFRIERQSLAALPWTNGILFGIRIETFPLRELKREEEARTRLITALETMTEPVAAYKGLGSARPRLLELLKK